MTDTAEVKKPFKERFVDDFKSLNVKQILGIVVALVISVALYVMGFGTQCFGFFIAAVVLYMIPHLLGVTSVSVKAVVGVLFIVVALLIGTFAYSGTIATWEDASNFEGDRIYDIGTVENDDGYTLEFTVAPEDLSSWEVRISYSPIESFAFGQAIAAHSQAQMNEDLITLSPSDLTMHQLDTDNDGTADKTVYTGSVDVPTEGYLMNIAAVALVDTSGEARAVASSTFLVNLGADSGTITGMCASGAGYTIAFAAAIFFILLIFSALMRRSLEKTRTKMEAQGRLYPQGYGRCKECGAMVLPGEVTCRKCGAYIDVPDEMRAHKKDFFECSECGAEVPSDAKVCPKCGARFDSEETEVRHADGTVEVSTGTKTCPDCGAEVPDNVDFCPKCGRKFERD